MPVSYLETGVLYCQDNLPQLAQFPAECVDLIYLDPPFFSNREYEVIWGDEAEVRSFEDRWQGGINVYINWMRERVREMHRVLKPTGSLYLHCDSHASHYLKVMLDEVFLPTNFRNEIIWKRTHSHGGAKRYGPVHDTILFYTRTDQYVWNPQYTPYSAEYTDGFFRFQDPDGRKYRATILTGSGVRHGSSGKPWRGIDPTKVGRHWAIPGYVRPLLGDLPSTDVQTALDRLDSIGRILWPAKAEGTPSFKQYMDDMAGVGLQDIWTDLPPISAQAKERLGYPTQKPEALLLRIISASTAPGQVVLDPFCGCGTTVVAAEQLKRQWIGIDISPTAVNLMKRRLEIIGVSKVKLVGMPVSVDALKRLKPFEFQNWVIQRLNGTHSPRKSGDMGIDGFSFMLHEPIQVKQSEDIGRNVVDNFETAVQRDGKQKGYIVGFSFTKGAVEEAARAKAKLGLDIELVRVSALLRDVTSLITPVGGHLIATVPLPPPRPVDTLPAATDLIKSDRQTA